MAFGLCSIVITMNSLDDWDRFPTLYRPVAAAAVVGAALALVIGWLHPTPWLLAVLLLMTLTAVWVFANYQWLQLDDPEAALPEA